ncbi:MAG: radical SAM protein [Phycisphaerales bacterium]
MLGRFADAKCRAIHGDHLRTYVIDRNINYTNICTAKCTFCAFRRSGHEHDVYTLEHEQIHEKIAELSDIGGTQILMQGGMNPDLPLDWYLELLSGIKEKFPHIHIHAFSPPEFIEFVNFFAPPGADLEAKIRWVMVRLREAGLDSLPGGGGEIFSDPVRRKIGLGKCTADAWLTCMYVAHSLGMFTSATMMFGHIEGYADRVHHMRLCASGRSGRCGRMSTRAGRGAITRRLSRGRSSARTRRWVACANGAMTRRDGPKRSARSSPAISWRTWTARARKTCTRSSGVVCGWRARRSTCARRRSAV